ncbi:MAG: substrate-binding domain-containing protein [Gemmatimonadota bacterium]
MHRLFNTKTIMLALSLGMHEFTPLMAQARAEVILATTTSTNDSGLLDSLIPAFEKSSGVRVKIIAVGTGAALEMARRGDADAVLVHAPALERDYTRSGDLVEGRLIMHNDFVLVGPPHDPAGVARCKDLACAMGAMARDQVFISRGDKSGTHQMEMALWRLAGIPPDSVRGRVETGQGMGATLDVAEQRLGYTLTDRGTFLAHRTRATLAILFEGDPRLLNVYHAYVVNPLTHPATHTESARALVEFLASPAGQATIDRFGRARFGRPLFIPDVGRDTMALMVPAEK